MRGGVMDKEEKKKDAAMRKLTVIGLCMILMWTCVS